MLSVVSFGCGHSLMQPTVPEGERIQEGATVEATVPATTAEYQEANASTRQLGDFATYRFSGSYRETPVTVSYRVVDQDYESLLLDVTVESDGTPERFRLSVSDGTAGASEILSAARLLDGAEQPIPVAEYEALMQQTVAPIEHNEEQLEAQDHELRIGDQPVACTRASYRVIVAGEPATMTVFESASFAWGDLGGEITSADGELLYKAEIVDAGGVRQTASRAIAAAMEELDVDELDL
jgi:hypothetical protein